MSFDKMTAAAHDGNITEIDTNEDITSTLAWSVPQDNNF